MTWNGVREDGVYRQSVPDGVWAWVGVGLAPITPTAGSGLYSDMSEPRRRADAFATEMAWIAAQRSTAGPLCFDLRYLSDPGSGSLSCAILGRVFAPDNARAAHAAVALRERLAAVPDHVAAEPFADTADVRHWLAPIEPHLDGLTEIRKRLTHHYCTRTDTGRRLCFAVSAFTDGDRSWEPLWRALARQQYPTLVSICLEPYMVGDGLRYALSALAGEYAVLATEIPPRPYKGRVPADTFAIEAQPLYAEAVRCYTDHAYRIRVSVASAGPLDPAFGELLAATISPPVRDGAFGGGGPVVRRPAPEELQPAWANITTSGREWLDATYRQGSPPDFLNEPERILCDLVDVPEAAAAFHLPYEVAGDPLLFGIPGRSVVPPPATTSDDRRWDVALSFAGAQRPYVKRVAAALRARGVRCFYDADEQIDLWGRYLAEELPVIYAERASVVVVFVSADYAAGDWTNLERRAALNRAVRERREYVLPARFDDTALPGLLSDMVAIDLRAITPERFGMMVADKLGRLEVIASGTAPPTPEMRNGEDRWQRPNAPRRPHRGTSRSTDIHSRRTPPP